MESSSIVSFNNDSTYQSTLKADYSASVHELALHAMRDRCLLLQRRVNTLESDNMRLKLDVTTSGDKTNYTLQNNEKQLMQQKIAELNKQKSQLLHHVFMVSCENKNLWHKLSTIKGSEKVINNCIKQPLVRTNTYIHSTPKYNNSQAQEKFSDSSLEEISLKFINSYIQEKSQLVEQYEQMVQLQDFGEDVLNVDSIGFTYMEDPSTDSLKEIHSQTEKLQALKKELAQQEKDLKIVISRVETILKEGYKCPSCLANKSKVSHESKETETSDSLTGNETQLDSIPYHNEYEDENPTPNKRNIEQQDVTSESYDKMCPICGELFQKDTVFTDFQSHVESHFVGDNESDSIEHFDTLPNSLDNII